MSLQKLLEDVDYNELGDRIINKIYKKVPIEDIPEVYDLYCREEKCDVLKDDLYKAIKIYKQLLEQGCYTYSCYINDKIVGVVNVYKNMQYYPTDLNAPYVHLECVIVDKLYQNQGIGTELITKAVELIKKECCTYIIEQSSNPYMQKAFLNGGLTNQKCKDYRYEEEFNK